MVDPMPTLHEPQLTEVSSVWREPSVQMARELAANKEVVLGKLRFYCEHGRPEDWEGKFAKQVLAHEEEVLSEIVGILTLAASLAVMLSPGVVIATLQRVLIEPALIFQSTFPSEVAWILADFYQRNKETPGTFWPDIMGERPHNFPGRNENPLGNVSRLLQLQR